MQRIGVFCGSSGGARASYEAAAIEVADALAERGLGLVYGGSHRGLMGALADRMLARGGEVIGVIPRSMVEREIAHTGLADLRVVESMHERKALMAALSDGFIALPGGFGTFEELCEAITWTQLGIHPKPCGVLNVDGFYDAFLAFLNHAVGEGFIRPAHRAILHAGATPGELLDAFARFEPPDPNKWIGSR